MTILYALLHFLASQLVSPITPDLSGQSVWHAVAQDWEDRGGIYYYSLTSEKIVETCSMKPDDVLLTPIVLQGAQVLKIDGVEIARTGDPAFKKASSIYSTLAIQCRKLIGAHTLQWEVFTATPSLAMVRDTPIVSNPMPIQIYLSRPIILLVIGALLAIAIFGFITFFGKLPGNTLFFFFLTAFFYSNYLLFTVSDFFDIPFSPLTSQKLSDGSLWIAFACTFRMLFLLGHISKRKLTIITSICLLSLGIIVLSQDFDQIQLGSDLAIVSCLTVLITMAIRTFISINKHTTTLSRSIIEFGIILTFVVTGLNDGLLFLVGLDTMPIFPLGSILNLSLIALAANKHINHTYEERDHLRANLEKEVEIKTRALTEKTTQLKKTLVELTHAQADLVQSAKLASIGTLAAGIAHEINNSLNYVNGSIFPLEMWLKRLEVPETEKSKPQQFLGLMKEGLQLTFDIITNLKRQASSSSSEKESVHVKELVDGILAILKHRLNGVTIEQNIDPGVLMLGNRPGLSQVLMNLISNGAEAIEEQLEKDKESIPSPTIRITVLEHSGEVSLYIEDNGPGIPQEIQSRIFDPFFTTKPTGKGTGLGLYIVQSEVKKMGGKLKLVSSPGNGAQFILQFPQADSIPSEKDREAA